MTDHKPLSPKQAVMKALQECDLRYLWDAESNHVLDELADAGWVLVRVDEGSRK